MPNPQTTNFEWAEVLCRTSDGSMSDMVVENPDRVCIEPIKPGSFWIGIYKNGNRQCVVFHASEKTDWVGETFQAVKAHAYKDENYAE